MERIAAVACVLLLALAGAAPPIAPKAFAQGQPLIHIGTCPSLLDQVCARSRKKVLITYPNECLARTDRAKIISKGACPEACPMVYDPVCAADEAGRRRTYGNACQAKATGARVVSNRRCLSVFRRR